MTDTDRASQLENVVDTLAPGTRRGADQLCVNCSRLLVGTWPSDDLRRAFVAGASWWQFHKNGATIFESERDQAEAEAEDRYAKRLS